jgi:hypothetical protein
MLVVHIVVIVVMTALLIAASIVALLVFFLDGIEPLINRAETFKNFVELRKRAGDGTATSRAR